VTSRTSRSLSGVSYESTLRRLKQHIDPVPVKHAPMESDSHALSLVSYSYNYWMDYDLFSRLLAASADSVAQLSAFRVLSASIPLMIGRFSEISRLGDELQLDSDEYADPPLEDYSSWRRVDATVVRGSGVPTPMFDPSDDDW